MTALEATANFDADKAAAFEERFVGVLNDGALALMTSIGHRTGLFDAMADLAPARSEDIARTAGLDERYVREWLGAMVTGGFVEHDSRSQTYYLPAEHAACLTRAATPNNLSVYAQYIPLLGGVEDAIVECFRSGGGVPYEQFTRFHAVMAEDSGQTVVPAIVEHILPLQLGLVERLQAGIDALDIGCGSGRAAVTMAHAFPNSRFVGYDFSAEAIANARHTAQEAGVENVRFEVADVANLSERKAFDLITAFDAIHDQANPALVLANIAKALRPDGTFLMQDISGSSHVHNNVAHPIGTLLYTVSCLHCMTVSLAQGGAGLGAMWGRETAQQMLSDAGFSNVWVHDLAHDIQNQYYVASLH